METVARTDLPDLRLVHRGKVRDMYEIPGHDEWLLMIATDRISAFDVVMREPIPGKGRVLTRLSLFWFDYLRDIADNHLVTADVDEYPPVCRQYKDVLDGRSMLVRRVEILPVECIVRGYLSGSFWKAYRREGPVVCGFELPPDMRESDPFPEPLFTPSTKAEQGEHDENISLDRMTAILGEERARQVAEISVRLYEKAAAYARERGIIIADTKFEFGLADGQLVLADEVLTPDSSRFWPADQYAPGRGQPSFDKQFLRDYLLSLDWNKQPPPPPLPQEIVDKTRRRYEEALQRLLD